MEIACPALGFCAGLEGVVYVRSCWISRELGDFKHFAAGTTLTIRLPFPEAGESLAGEALSSDVCQKEMGENCSSPAPQEGRGAACSSASPLWACCVRALRWLGAGGRTRVQVLGPRGAHS